MIKIQRISILLILAVMSMASNCNGPEEVAPFDKGSLLVNFSDNLICSFLVDVAINNGTNGSGFR